MFYQCPQCKKRWQFPLTQCAQCFVPLEKLESQSAKVIGISTVTMPCISQMEVPYFVLVLQDEHGNIWAQKSSAEYKIGDNFEWEVSDTPDSVAIVRHKYDLPETLGKLLKLINLKDLAGKKVFLLPSLNAASHPYFHDNTTPEFLDAVINWLKTQRVAEIKIGTQSFSKPLEVLAQKSGLLAVCAKHKIMPTDLAQKEFEGRGEFHISKEVAGCDLLIDLGVALEGKAAVSANLLYLLPKDEALKILPDIGGVKKLAAQLPKVICFAEMEFAQDKESFTNFYGLYLAGYEPLLVDKALSLIMKSEDETLFMVKEDEIKNIGCRIREVSQKI